MQLRMRLSCCIYLVFIYLFSAFVNGSSQSDMDVVKARMLDDNTPDVITPYNERLVRTMMKDILPAGNWSNINYTNTYNKPPWQHLDNIEAMTRAYVAPGALRRDSTLISKIHLALAYWFSANITNKNWWWNSIGFRQYEGPICLLLQNVSALTTGEKSSCTTFLNRGATAGFTGANMVWTAQTQIYNAVLNRNIPYLFENFALAFNESAFTYGVDDGIKVDGSFFQHGPLEYSGGYGYAFTKDTLGIVAWAKDTVFQISASNLAVLSTHVLDGQQWMIYLPSMTWDINCKGREITREGGLTAKGFLGIKHPGGARATEWTQFIARFNNNATNLKIGNKAYYTSDYMVHARKGWQTTFRGYSTRTRSAECINSEGKKSLHIADGANYLVRTGSEYYNVFPLWNWELIPGTTIEQGAVPVECSYVPPYQNFKGTGKTDFVGVVSNGMYGAATHDLSGPQTSTLTAKKSWFFFDKEYVCLGADIAAPSSSRVYTTVDQKNLKGPVTVSSSSGKTVLSSTVYSNYATAWWAHHDSVGYIFPEWKSTNNTFKFDVNTTSKEGDWISIGMNEGDAAGSTFILSLPRKQSTAPDTYAYIVVPEVNVTAFEKQASITKSQIQIKANTRNAQAVYHTALSQFHATFWTSGVPINTGAGYTVRSLRSCLIMLIPGSGKLDLVISDPSQLQKWTGISINKEVTCAECKYSDGYTTVNVTLPVYPYAGKSKIIPLVYA